VLGAPGTQHPYAYGLNNPLTYADPSGKSVILLLMATAFLGGVLYDAYVQYHQPGGWACYNPLQAFGTGIGFALFVGGVAVTALSLGYLGGFALHSLGVWLGATSLGVGLPAWLSSIIPAWISGPGLWVGTSLSGLGLGMVSVSEVLTTWLWTGKTLLPNSGNVSTFTPFDSDDLRDFGKRAPAIQSDRGQKSFADTWGAWADLIDDGRVNSSDILIYRSDGKIMGAMKIASGPNALKITHLEGLGNGAGTRLIQAAIDESINRGYDGRIMLEAASQAVGFYEKLGFVLVDKGNVYYLDADRARDILR